MSESDMRFGYEGVPLDAGALTHWNAQQRPRALCCPAHRPGIALVATEVEDTLQWICPECGQRQPVLEDQALTALGVADAPAPFARQVSTSLDYLVSTSGWSSDGTVLFGWYDSPHQIFVGKDDRAIIAGAGVAVTGVLGAYMLSTVVPLAPLVLAVLIVTLTTIVYLVTRRATAPIARSWKLPVDAVRPGDWLAIDTPGRNRPARPYRVGNAYGARVLQITRVGATGEILLHLLGGRSFTARDTELVTVVELADSRANDYSFHTPGLIIAPVDDDLHIFEGMRDYAPFVTGRRDFDEDELTDDERSTLVEMCDYATSIIGTRNFDGIKRSELLEAVSARYPLAFTMRQSLERELARNARSSSAKYGLLGATWVTQNRQVQRLRDMDCSTADEDALWCEPTRVGR